MKTKTFLTMISLVSVQLFFAQEIKSENPIDIKNVVTDTIKTVIKENQTKVEKSISNADVDLKAEKKAEKEADKLLKEEQKAKKEVENRQKEIAKNQKKLEKQQDRIEKEQKEQIKKQKNINLAEEAINKANDNLKDAQKELVKDAEKHNKKLDKGKLSPQDIEKYQNDKIKQEKKIEDLKAKILKAETKLRKAKK